MVVTIIKKTHFSSSLTSQISSLSELAVKECLVNDIFNDRFFFKESDVFIFDAYTTKWSEEDIAAIQHMVLCSDIPILLVCSSGTPAHYRERMVDSGVDGCLQAPYLQEEFTLRLKKLIQKRNNLLFKGTHIKTEFFDVDVKNHVVVKKGKEVLLTRIETCLLEHLLLKKNHPVSTEELSCYIESGVDKKSALHIHVLNLRKKLNAKRSIITLPHYGFLVR